MKRDLVILGICICVLCATSLIGAKKIVQTSAIQSVPRQAPVLILDAGHGGEDGGAVTAGGDKESGINLSIVLKLEQLMAFLGQDVILTRDTDCSIHSDDSATLHEKKVSDLKNRVALVNSQNNAMLISIHQNYFTDPRYKGAQVFYGPGDIGRQWGEYTQEVLKQLLDPNNHRAAKTIPDSIYLFSHVDCPALLVECGFLSNGEEASLLLTDNYQRKIALALAGSYLHQLQMMPNDREA